MRILLGIALAVGMFGTAKAQDADSVGALVDGCRAVIAFTEGRRGSLDDDMARTHECAASVRALAYVSSQLPSEVASCKPRGVTYTQIMRVVVAYADARPQRMNDDFRDLTLEAMRRAWPCPAK